MTKETLRQKLFPNFDDAEEAGEDKWYGEFGVIFGRYIRTAALIWALSWSGCNLVGNNITYSEGVRKGSINKISKKGLFWKTYEGQMALEGIVSGSGKSGYVGANVWDFSLDNFEANGEDKDSLAIKIQEYLESGTRVKMTYVQPFATWPWRSYNNYLVQGVEPVKE